MLQDPVSLSFQPGCQMSLPAAERRRRSCRGNLLCCCGDAASALGAANAAPEEEAARSWGEPRRLGESGLSGALLCPKPPTPDSQLVDCSQAAAAAYMLTNAVRLTDAASCDEAAATATEPLLQRDSAETELLPQRDSGGSMPGADPHDAAPWALLFCSTLSAEAAPELPLQPPPLSGGSASRVCGGLAARRHRSALAGIAVRPCSRDSSSASSRLPSLVCA